VACLAANRANYWAAALCAGGQSISPEQAVIANCALSIGVRSIVLASCVEARFSVTELGKCLSLVDGTLACFRDAQVVKIVHDAWQGIASDQNNADAGGSVFNTGISTFNNPGQLTGGPNSVVNNPGQIIGGPNSVLRNADQVLGGPNSFVRKNLGIHF
jgi:hypothetical protein